MVDMFRRVVRAAMRQVARDETELAAGRSALVLAPHPDDETLGCGASILRKIAAGSMVTVLVVTDGRHSHRTPHLPPSELAELRHSEMVEAARRLGLPADSVRWAGFVDGNVQEHEDKLVDVIGELLAVLKPDDVYATSIHEPHPDHAAVGRAARRAVTRARGPLRLLEYPVWLWAAWPLRRGARVRSTVDAANVLLRRRVIRVATAQFLSGKLHALDAHSSQLRRPDRVPYDADWAALPPSVLGAASDRVELFLVTVRPRGPSGRPASSL